MGVRDLFRGKQKEKPVVDDIDARIASAGDVAGCLAALRDGWIEEAGEFALTVHRRRVKQFRARFPAEEELAIVLESLLGVRRVTPESSAQVVAAAEALRVRPGVRFEVECSRAQVFVPDEPLRAFSALWRASQGGDDVELIRRALVRRVTSLGRAQLARAEATDRPTPIESRAILPQIGLSFGLGLAGALAAWRVQGSVREPIDELNADLAHASARTIALTNAHLGMLECLRIARPWAFTEANDGITLLARTMTELRVEKTPPEFVDSERREHRTRLSKLGGFYAACRKQYDDYLPWEEYLAELERRPKQRAQRFLQLHGRHRDCTYYAYRAACDLEDAGAVDEARGLWIHAAQTLGAGLRSEVASVLATIHAFRFEAEYLARLRPERRIPGQKALLAHLEARARIAGACGFFPAELALTDRAARLAHALAVQAVDPDERTSFADAARRLYLCVDDERAAASVLDAEPEDPLGPIVVPLWDPPF